MPAATSTCSSRNISTAVRQR